MHISSHPQPDATHPHLQQQQRQHTAAEFPDFSVFSVSPEFSVNPQTSAGGASEDGATMKQRPEDWGNEKTSGGKNWENKNWEIREVNAGRPGLHKNEHTSAYASIRQHTSAEGSLLAPAGRPVERAVGAVEMHLRLNMDFQAAGQEGSAERAVFVTVVKVHVYEALSY